MFILKLFASKNKSLLVWWDAFLVLNFGFHSLNGVRGFYLKGDGFASVGLHKDLHSTGKTPYQMNGGFLLDIVV